MLNESKILLINPPHTAIGSRIPREHLPPLGLLSIGGPLIDASFEIALLDADLESLAPEQIVSRALQHRPRIVMIGHSGSSSGHVTVLDLCARLKRALPGLLTVYGGVHPSYHGDEILRDAPQIDLVVRGEGERSTVELVRALAQGTPLEQVRGTSCAMPTCCRCTAAPA